VNVRVVSVLAFALFAVTACKKDEAATTTPPPLPSAAATAAPAAAAPAATTAVATAAAAAPATTSTVPAGDVPTSEDYEQTALNEINPQNMEAELDKLEKDIAK
jgi:hypothetical protein